MSTRTVTLLLLISAGAFALTLVSSVLASTEHPKIWRIGATGILVFGAIFTVSMGALMGMALWSLCTR